jgi:hypothetical protein
LDSLFKPRLPTDPRNLEPLEHELHGLCLRRARWAEAAQNRIPEDLQPFLLAATQAVKEVPEAVEARLGLSDPSRPTSRSTREKE